MWRALPFSSTARFIHVYFTQPKSRFRHSIIPIQSFIPPNRSEDEISVYKKLIGIIEAGGFRPDRDKRQPRHEYPAHACVPFAVPRRLLLFSLCGSASFLEFRRHRCVGIRLHLGNQATHGRHDETKVGAGPLRKYTPPVNLRLFGKTCPLHPSSETLYMGLFHNLARTPPQGKKLLRQYFLRPITAVTHHQRKTSM